MKLYYYTDDFVTATWAKNPQHWRELTGIKDGNPVRVVHKGVEPPAGYHKPNGYLAFDAVERLPLWFRRLAKKPVLSEADKARLLKII